MTGYVVDDFVPRRVEEVRDYLNHRASVGWELVTVIRFENQYGTCERYIWRYTKPTEAR